MNIYVTEELFRHVHYRHTYENPHKCTQCYYASTRPSDLKRHIKSLHTHSDKPIKCKRCDDVFPDLHTFKVLKQIQGSLTYFITNNYLL